MGLVRSVAVFCGAQPGRDPAFRRAAEAMGAGPAGRGMRLVYRQEAETLQRVAAIDQQMVGHAATIRLLADQLSGEPAPDVKAKIDTHTGAVTALIRSRRDVLT